MNLPELQTDRLLLRPAEPEDVEALVDYHVRNVEHLQPFSPIPPPGFHTPAFWRQRVEQGIDEFHLDVAYRFFLFPIDDPGHVIGHASFSQIFRGPFHACYLGYTIDREWEGRGLMFEGLSHLVPWVFEARGLHRIMANYMPHNRRSGALLKRLEFVVEGYARDYLQINGVWEDHLLTSRTNPDWEGDTFR